MAVYMCILSKNERGDFVRVKGKLQWINCRFDLLSLIDNIKEGLALSSWT